MSGINGDKARFHRERKKKIARRERRVEMLKRMAENQHPAAPPAAKPIAVAV